MIGSVKMWRKNLDFKILKNRLNKCWNWFRSPITTGIKIDPNRLGIFIHVNGMNDIILIEVGILHYGIMRLGIAGKRK